MYKSLLYARNCLQAESDAKYVMERYFHVLKIRKNANVLDIGCGPGNITVKYLAAYLSKNANKIVGIDISTAMVEFALRNYKNDPKLVFQEMDILNQNHQLQFFQSFDNIFSFYCLHFLSDQRKALTNMYNMLKPGGEILLTFLSKCPIPLIYKSLCRENKWKPYFNDAEKIFPTQNYKEPENYFKKLLIETGYTVHSCVAKKKIYVYSKELFKDTMISVNNFIIPDKLEEDFALAHIQFMRDHDLVDTDDDGNEYFHFPYTLIIVHAEKPSSF